MAWSLRRRATRTLRAWLRSSASCRRRCGASRNQGSSTACGGATSSSRIRGRTTARSKRRMRRWRQTPSIRVRRIGMARSRRGPLAEGACASVSRRRSSTTAPAAAISGAGSPISIAIASRFSSTTSFRAWMAWRARSRAARTASALSAAAGRDRLSSRQRFATTRSTYWSIPSSAWTPVHSGWPHSGSRRGSMPAGDIR